MNVKNCRRCKRLFNYMVGPVICPACRDIMEQEFQKVKKYIEENPHCDIRTVSEECEVDSQQIRDWVRDERLQFSEDSMVALNCERCGAVIRSGRFCDACKKDMTTGFNNAIGANKKKIEPARPTNNRDNPKMRFLDK